MENAKIGLLGALAGTVTALFGLAFVSSRLLQTSLDAFVLQGVGRSRSFFEATTGASYVLVVVAGLGFGGLIAYVTGVIARAVHPDEAATPLSWLTALGAVITAIVAYIVLRSGVGVAGSIEAGVLRLSVSRMVVTVAVMGALAGALTVTTVYRLAFPAVLGLEGDAWPSKAAFVRESMAAMGIPVVAVIAIFGVVVGLAQVMLSGSNVVAIAVAAGVAVLVLAGAAFLAYVVPPKR